MVYVFIMPHNKSSVFVSCFEMLNHFTSFDGDSIDFIQDLFHVFLKNFEIAIFILFINLFTLLFSRYVNVILKKWEPPIK